MQVYVGNSKLIRRANMAAVLSLIRANPHISRIEIAQTTGLVQSTISQIIRQLVDEGLVAEDGIGKPSGGRRRIGLQIVPESRWTLCCSFNNHQTTFALMDLGGDLHLPISIATQSETPSEIPAELADQLKSYLARVKHSRENLLGIALSSQGTVSPQEGTVRSPVSLRWDKGVCLRSYLESALNLPVFIEADTNAAAFGELHYGKGRGVENLIYINVGSGIGCGLVIDGKIYRGRQGAAGEFGHTSIDQSGLPCSCGNRGCIENIASIPAIVASARAATGRPDLNFGEIAAAAISGDPIVCRVVDEALSYLSKGLHNLISLFDPEILVIGGPITQLGAFAIDRIRKYLASMGGIVPFESERVVLSDFGEQAELVGIGMLFLESAFDLRIPGMVKNLE